jgi:hypothetical protein
MTLHNRHVTNIIKQLEFALSKMLKFLCNLGISSPFLPFLLFIYPSCPKTGALHIQWPNVITCKSISWECIRILRYLRSYCGVYNASSPIWYCEVSNGAYFTEVLKMCTFSHSGPSSPCMLLRNFGNCLTFDGAYHVNGLKCTIEFFFCSLNAYVYKCCFVNASFAKSFMSIFIY